MSLEKNFFEAELSCDRSYRLSNGSDRSANVRAIAAFTAGYVVEF